MTRFYPVRIPLAGRCVRCLVRWGCHYEEQEEGVVGDEIACPQWEPLLVHEAQSLYREPVVRAQMEFEEVER